MNIGTQQVGSYLESVSGIPGLAQAFDVGVQLSMGRDPTMALASAGSSYAAGRIVGGGKSTMPKQFQTSTINNTLSNVWKSSKSVFGIPKDVLKSETVEAVRMSKPSVPDEKLGPLPPYKKTGGK